MKRRVVITGLGALTAVGEGAEALWQAAVEKRTGIGPVRFDDEGWEVTGAAVRDFVPEKYVTQRKSLKVMARDIQLAVAASNLAIADAGLRSAPFSKERFGVIVGSGVLNHELDELAASVKSSLDSSGVLDLKKFGSDGLSALFPLWLLKYLPNMAACHISILFDLQGPNNSITTGASAGLQAVSEGVRIIQRGDADLMLCGGAESKLNPVGYAEYKVLGVLREGSEEGVLIGEGAGFVVVEELEHARARRARIYAEVAGLGASSSGGRALAMRGALNEAGVEPRELDYLEACAIGVPGDDRAEKAAIQEVFEGTAPNLNIGSSKAIVGFAGFASGPIDLILTALVLKQQKVPAAVLSKKIRTAMANAFGFNGQSASIVLKSFEAPS